MEDKKRERETYKGREINRENGRNEENLMSINVYKLGMITAVHIRLFIFFSLI